MAWANKLENLETSVLIAEKTQIWYNWNAWSVLVYIFVIQYVFHGNV